MARDVLERPYTGGGGGVAPACPPPPLPMFEADGQNFASALRGLRLKIFLAPANPLLVLLLHMLELCNAVYSV